MARSFRGAFCTKRSKGVFGTQSYIKDEFWKMLTAYFCKKRGVWLGSKCAGGKSAKMQLLNKLSEIVHKFVISIFFFFKIVILTAAFGSRPTSNFNHLHQRSFFRKSPTQMFFKICVSKNFANLTGKHPRWSLFLIKLQALGL